MPPVHPVSHRAPRLAHVPITGLTVSAASMHLLRELAIEARVPTLRITSVHRSVADQARIFFDKHVVEGKAAKYKNAGVKAIVNRARTLHSEGHVRSEVQGYMINAIEHIHGGPRSVSNHLGAHIFTEVFDVAHYSGPTSGAGRHNHLTNAQAAALLADCRKRMPSTITRLGHSAELGLKLPSEFVDEKCFHFEVKQVLYDKLEVPSDTRVV